MGAMGKAVRSTLGGIALAVAFALAVPFLVPGSYFIPEVTRFASERLAQPVEMEDLTLHLLPTPRVIGHRISVGKRGEILIGELEIVPELHSLIVGPRSLRLVRASRVAFDDTAALQLNAINWTLPFGAPLTFDALAAHGMLKGRQLEVAKVEADLYGGR